MGSGKGSKKRVASVKDEDLKGLATAVPAAKKSSAKKSSVKKSAAKELAGEKPSVKDLKAKDPSANELAGKKHSAKEQSAKKTSAKKLSEKKPSAKTPAAAEEEYYTARHLLEALRNLDDQYLDMPLVLIHGKSLQKPNLVQGLIPAPTPVRRSAVDSKKTSLLTLGLLTGSHAG